MNPNDPAFPVPAIVLNDVKHTKIEVMPGTGGMPIRLYIATHALQGLLARSEPLADTEQRLFARTALGLADALIEQEKKSK